MSRCGFIHSVVTIVVLDLCVEEKEKHNTDTGAESCGTDF